MDLNPEILDALRGGKKKWLDIEDGRVEAATLYLVQGCKDWNKCIFCGLPDAVRSFNNSFLDGRSMSDSEHLNYFLANLKGLDVHTLMIFNAGSFFARQVNSFHLQENILTAVVEHPSIKRLVVESRAPLLTIENLKAVEILHRAGKRLTVRIGVETYSDKLRNKVLRKGFTRLQILQAVKELHNAGIEAGAYTLLQPAPGLTPEEAVDECKRTLEWVLGPACFDEAYFEPTCVPMPMEGIPPTPIFTLWEEGKFNPATLWMTWDVLKKPAEAYPGKIHLLPFSDQPPFVAVPSNHVPRGVSEALEGAEGCDKEFHEMFDKFRKSYDSEDLIPPVCGCRPSWI